MLNIGPWCGISGVQIYGKIQDFRIFSYFRYFFAFFKFFIGSLGPGRHLETFLEPVASFSQSISPWRATATHFRPEITYFGRPKMYMSAQIRPRLIRISRSCNFTMCFWRWDSPSAVRVARFFWNSQFYDVFLKVRLTKCCKGCTGIFGISILLHVFEGGTHQVP